MKYVIVPEHVTIVDQRGEHVLIRQETFGTTDDEMQTERCKQCGNKIGSLKSWTISMEQFVYHNICSHPDIPAGGGNGARRKRKIEDLFDNCKPGDVIGIEDADYQIARNVVDHLTWAPHFARYADQMLPLIEAWEVADKQDGAWKKKYDAEMEKVTPLGDGILSRVGSK